MATTETAAVVAIAEALERQRAEREEPRDREYLQLRRDLDIGAFAVNAVTADAGKALVEERTATGYARDGHEELYVVLRGRAAFTVDGERTDAPSGTAVFVRDADARRAAVSEEDGTTVLVIGGRRGLPWRPTPGEAMGAFFPLYEAQDYEGALRVAEQVLEEYPGNGLALFNVACMESMLGRREDALRHLEEALAAAPELVENARTDDDLASLRDEPRFRAAVA